MTTDTADTAVDWPPGTVRLEDMRPQADGQVLLQPRPTEDPNDPLNWSGGRKYLNFGLVCLYVVMVNEFINASTPTWGPMQTQLGYSNEQLNDSYAIGCAALATGSIILIPFALKFGRRPIVLVSTVAQFALSIWSAKMQTVADLLLINFLQCFLGSLTEVLVQMTVADLFFVHQRGRLNGLYIWVWWVAGALGPLIAGYITLGQGWRWVWWWNAIFFGACVVIIGFAYEESKFDASVITALPEPETIVEAGKSDKAKADCIREPQAGGPPDPCGSIPIKTYWQRMALTTSSPALDTKTFLRHMYQPFILLATIPGIAWVALVYGILVALGDVMSTTLSTFMKQPPYNFDSHQIGLMSLPQIIGITLGSLIGGPLSDWVVLFISRRNKGIYEPEARLWCMLPFLVFIPLGALLFGLGLNNGLSWPVIAVGFALYNIGVAPINAITITYLTDSYKDVIGDALVGVTVIRNSFSTAFIFALTPWISAIGIKYVFVTILLIACAILAFSAVFIKWGKQFRSMSADRYRRYALWQYQGRM
ncbi:hypothetical protein ASPZODRAFT_23017 [Penicilliopsis zonata CBS 506.65]|uniref:Major facilitator superfamily (MFS) profile domain-containing protein n=1 Tax=Penicilliopsis zonata CBS 506.65 TaxID=1073090 RepID=A0A1L9STA1_9EURO|nr:hypothetical protein ASPZODRAFT_23017 [Penicilliopsis zonata CBS 506.65]OJJ50366.1 hypothetical protein ASPZODRAFT_23017 [Penicilliopsis zonata CBS 506.65]